jgi:proteic killer suppression protein
MVILFETADLKQLCSEEREANRQLGRPCAKKLVTRLADLRAAQRVTDLVAGHPHPLKGDRAGQFALDLHGGKRLVFTPAHDPLPLKDDDSIDWSQVTSIRIVFIGDYHD